MHGTTPTDGYLSPGSTIAGFPEQIPLFPLSGVVLLPGEVLPLHIFEPRYRTMIHDTITDQKIIGMVEYDKTTADPGPATEAIRQVGCAGFIADHKELPDGRFLIWLVGLERFHVDRELDVDTPYRQAQVAYTPVHDDAVALAGLQSVRLELRRTLPYLVELEDSDRATLESQLVEITDSQLLALASQILELPAPRKRELLEATSQSDRFLLLFEDLYRHLDSVPIEVGGPPPTLN
ncbi:MAG: LON peptidase substrate-binding domain-containing protein [Thermoanaerobaculales bacterium]|jgi:Lon protease-like protein|nr:LON peptidase substrate-binding domain-containing protein [Thermoanaerobaculales bacterium]